MRLPVIVAAAFALAAFSATARPNPYGPGTTVGEVFGGSAWFNDQVGGVAVTGATYQECADRLAAAIAARSNWAVTSITPCAKWPPYIIIKSPDVEMAHAEAVQVLNTDRQLRAQFRIDQYEAAVQATFSTANICE
ncbi:hypothetical protein KYC5002_11630 [Archangium violaceum]|uniref:hypothetical protein n=1 Tax=Archangium violaceum TaxID=83451 RepID=UPI002B2D270D|nr:hypothetical protein KYC5002_11630 [Archangium gephyra]